MNNTRHQRRNGRNQGRRRGAVLVEFALVAPLFFTLLLAAFEFGRLNMLRNSAHNAAYEAARKVVVPGANQNEAVEEAKRILDVIGAQQVDVQVIPQVITEKTQEVTVTVSVPFDENSYIAPIFAKGKTIQATSKLKAERYRGIQ